MGTGGIHEEQCGVDHDFHFCGEFGGNRKRDLYCSLDGGRPRVDSDIGAKVRDDSDSNGGSREGGGIPAIAAVIVIVVGIFGGIVGPFVLNKLNIDSKIARGLSLGAAAHGLGTARAMELGALEGAISGLAIGLMGVMTAILVPVVEWVMSLF